LPRIYQIIAAGSTLSWGLAKWLQKHSVVVENLEAVMKLAHQITNTDKVIIFDGTYGSTNLSPAMGQFLLKKALDASVFRR
jgi:hypothetical protein